MERIIAEKAIELIELEKWPLHIAEGAIELLEAEFAIAWLDDQGRVRLQANPKIARILKEHGNGRN